MLFDYSMTATQSAQTKDDGQKNVAGLLTDETAADYVGGIEPRTIRAWRTCRGLPFLRVTPKVIRIRRVDLDKWLARHAVAMTRGSV